MTDNERKLIRAFEDVVWMAIRYAHGRHTFAPTIVREAVESVQSIDPSWKPQPDHVLKPMPEVRNSLQLPCDYLNDLFE